MQTPDSSDVSSRSEGAVVDLTGPTIRPAGTALPRSLCFLSACVLLLLGVVDARAQVSKADEDFWVTNGSVNAVTELDGVLYLGGDFTHAGRYTGSAVALNAVPATKATENRLFPVANGIVFAITSDGAGGWYLGGTFTSIDGIAVSGLAHVFGDGTLDPDWKPSVTGTVYALAVTEGVVYVGGSFTAVGGQARSNLAAVNTSTGALLAWTPNPNGTVYALASAHGVIYAGGDFTTVGGQSRHRLAAIHPTTGAPTVWNPDVEDGTIFALAVSGSVIYAGGTFSGVGLLGRGNLAAITSAGAVTSWAPFTDGIVYAFAVADGWVYIGGAFSDIDGQTRHHLGAATESTGAVTGWNPDANGNVYTIQVDGAVGSAYVGGLFTTVGGLPRNYVVAVDWGSASGVRSWDPSASNTSYAIAIKKDATNGDTIYLGGRFELVGGQARNRLAAFDVNTGRLTNWNPNANGTVWALDASRGRVYAGGDFTTVGGVARSRVAKIDTGDGITAAWNGGTDGSVYAIVATGTTVYVGGHYSTIGGGADARSCLAAIDEKSGATTSWLANTSGLQVYALDVNDGWVYAGGNFAQINGITRNGAAAITESGGSVTAWNPNVNGPVYAVAVNAAGADAYLGGAFSTVGGQPRLNIASVDWGGTGAVKSWNPGANAQVFALSYTRDIVYAGGAFTIAGGQSRSRLAAFDRGGAVRSWNPMADNTVLALRVRSGMAYAGGAFATVGGNPRRGVAAFAVPPSSLPTTNGEVHALAESDGILYLGGNFSSVGGQPRNKLAAVDTATGALTSWNPNTDGIVYSLAVSEDLVYVGGQFNVVNGQTRPSSIAAVDATTAAVTSWNPGMTGLCYALIVRGEVVYAGGLFDAGIVCTVAAINKSTGTATPMGTSGTDDHVRVLALSGSVLYRGGQFAFIGTSARKSVAANDLSTGALTSWNPRVQFPIGLSDSANAFAVFDDTLYMCGAFGLAGGNERHNAASFLLPSVSSSSWDPYLAGSGDAIAVRGNVVFVGGSFGIVNSNFSAQYRANLAAFDADSSVVTAWNPAAGADYVDICSALVARGGVVYLGGIGANGLRAVEMGMPAPSSVVATASGAAIDVSWADAGAKLYRVYRSTSSNGPFVFAGTATGTAFSDTRIQPNVPYFYAVTCVHGVESDLSQVASAIAACDVTPAFGGITSATDASTSGACAVQLGWSAATTACHSSSVYSVYRSTSAGFTPDASSLIATGVQGTGYADTSFLAPGTTYYYVVRAANFLGTEETNTASLAAMPLGCTAVAAPVSFLTVRATNGANRLDWVNPAGSQYAGFTMVRFRTDAFPTGPADGTLLSNAAGTAGARTTVNHTPLTNGTTYYYAVFVNNNAGTFSAARAAKGRPFATTGKSKWAMTTGASALAPPGIRPGAATYFVSNDRNLYAATIGAGGGAWPAGWTPATLNGPAQSRPPVVQTTIGAATNVVFLGAQDGRVYAVNADTGAFLWPVPPQLGTVVQPSPSGIFTAYNGAFNLLLVGARQANGSSTLFGLRLDGTTAWTIPNIGPISGTADVIYGNPAGGVPARVYFTSRRRTGGAQETLWCYEFTATGTTFKWALQLGDIDGSSIFDGTRLLVGTNSGAVFALDPATTGATLWQMPLGNGPNQGYVHPGFGDGRVYVSTTSRLWALSETTGAVEWSTPLTGVGSILNPSAPLLVPGTTELYVGSGDGRLYQVDATTGAIVASVVIGDGTKTVGPPGMDSTVTPWMLYVGTEGGEVYGVEAPLP